MENNLVKLEPCPFCGCRDRRVGIRRMGNNGYRVCCSKCGSLGPHVDVSLDADKLRLSLKTRRLERAEGACAERGKRKME